MVFSRSYRMLKQSLLALGLLGILSDASVAADAVGDIPAAPVVNDVAPAFPGTVFMSVPPPVMAGTA
jgi:outer membrane immunogenic protein